MQPVRYLNGTTGYRFPHNWAIWAANAQGAANQLRRHSTRRISRGFLGILRRAKRASSAVALHDCQVVRAAAADLVPYVERLAGAIIGSAALVPIAGISGDIATFLGDQESSTGYCRTVARRPRSPARPAASCGPSSPYVRSPRCRCCGVPVAGA